MSADQPRSPRAAAASRANGARGRGPVSAAGKQASAANSFKHGLFSLETRTAATLSPEVSAFAEGLAFLGEGSWGARQMIDTATIAASQLEQASALVQATRRGIAALLAADTLDMKALAQQAEALVRYGRYERRFRGRRDRALRKAMTLAADTAKPARPVPPSRKPAC